eukprot:TRINITY_DN2438_c0_g1_i3.p1 TRINITY_DN2438_c0_g1~~TRINITY_DN2438_c0_g1_i3.p1  ORF type:complete len:182 (-),score=30.43 TRINITY_DN2438_c0_g1_i3:484-1029(-)
MTERSIVRIAAHEKEVYDIAFDPKHTNLFVTVSADRSVRLFDLRDLQSCTVIYENSMSKNGFIQVDWNKTDPYYLAAISEDDPVASIFDIRFPTLLAAELKGHDASLNSITWAPHSNFHLCTGADDKQALMWDISSLPKPIHGPFLAYQAGSAVNHVTWSELHPESIGIVFGKSLEVLKIT